MGDQHSETTEQRQEWTAELLGIHPACNARCDDAAHRHAILVYVSLIRGEPGDDELARGFSVQVARTLGCKYLAHEPAEAPPAGMPREEGTLFAMGGGDADVAFAGGPITALLSGLIQEQRAYLVQVEAFGPIDPIRELIVAAHPELAAHLGMATGGGR